MSWIILSWLLCIFVGWACVSLIVHDISLVWSYRQHRQYLKQVEAERKRRLCAVPDELATQRWVQESKSNKLN